MSAIPGLSVAGVGVLSRHYPFPAGILILGASAVLLWMIFKAGEFDWGNIAAAIVVCIPLIIGGVLLMRVRKADA